MVATSFVAPSAFPPFPSDPPLPGRRGNLRFFYELDLIPAHVLALIGRYLGRGAPLWCGGAVMGRGLGVVWGVIERDRTWWGVVERGGAW